jgi:deoxyribodipyrimidine photo-lyase
VHVVWFKRDLRVRDHAPLAAAARSGAVLPLFVFEPELLTAPDYSERQVHFLLSCLRDLDAALRARGAALVTRVGRLPDVFDTLRADGLAIASIHAHEETGNAISYARDRRVRRWAREHGILMHEAPHGGVVRRLASRDAWAEEWRARTTAPLIAVPRTLTMTTHVDVPTLPDRAALVRRGIPLGPDVVDAQSPVGGERAGRALFRSFLWERGRDYRTQMGSPTDAPSVCSGLSAHLAYGTLSVRQAWHGARHRAAELESPAQVDRVWVRSLESFAARLQWRDHFMQKLEDEPSLEYQNVCRAYDGLRDETDSSRLDGWAAGQTGYPLIDACMRALAATGWLPFRMRAMVMSFAAYHLWQHWREPSLVLARAFTDYEPGIHYSQCQMQSGTTGINTFRIYNPYLQHARYDAQHVFVRRWVPELAALPDAYLIRPELTPPLEQQMAGCIIGRDYPLPIVAHETAYAAAKERMYHRRAEPQTRVAARAVYEKHGSRAQPLAERDL